LLPKQSRPDPGASFQGPTHPTLRANPFPEVSDLFCRLPLSTLFYQLEAVHLGALVCAAPSSSGREVRHPIGALLLPKLRRHFAEFLNHSSPDRLGILYPPTCVGLGYGHHVNIARGFSWQHGINDFSCIGSASRLRLYGVRIYLDPALRILTPGTTIAWAHLSFCVPSLLTAFQWVGSSRRTAP